MGPQDGSIALVEPLGSDSNLAWRRAAAFDTPLIHAHAVGRRRTGGMHRLPVLRAFSVREAGAADQTARGLLRMIDRRQHPPLRTPVINIVVGDGLRRNPL